MRRKLNAVDTENHIKLINKQIAETLFLRYVKNIVAKIPTGKTKGQADIWSKFC